MTQTTNLLKATAIALTLLVTAPAQAGIVSLEDSTPVCDIVVNTAEDMSLKISGGMPKEVLLKTKKTKFAAKLKKYKLTNEQVEDLLSIAYGTASTQRHSQIKLYAYINCKTYVLEL